jgi:uncharacterized protein
MPNVPQRVAAAFLTAMLLYGGPAAAQTASPDALAAGRELVVAMRGAEQFKTIVPLMLQQLKPAIVQGRPEVARDFDAMVPVLQELLTTQSAGMAKLLEDIAAIYARHFTVDEMRQLIAFYRAPLGQKLLDKMPTITQESMTAGQAFGQVLAGELQKRVVDELRKRGHKI